jgi:hypothetical protein
VSLISGFANQQATHEAYAGKDGFGKPTYSAAVTIRVRKEPSRGVRRSATGTDVAVETYYLTEAVVNLQDRIDGTSVRRVRDVVSKGGVRLGCEVWV